MDNFIDALLILSHAQRETMKRIELHAGQGQLGELFDYEAGNLTSPHAHGTKKPQVGPRPLDV